MRSRPAPPRALTRTAPITVISREKGSGTRSAFIELFGVEVDKEDKTVETADITDKTNVMMTSVSQNANAIGYISLGSLNDSVKALKIDGRGRHGRKHRKRQL